MKRRLIALLSVLAMISMGTVLAQTVTVGNASGLPGETVQVDVTIDNGTGAGVNFSLSNEPGSVAGLSAAVGTLGVGDHIADAHQPDNTTLNAIVYPNPVSDFNTGGGSLASLNVTISDALNGGDTINLGVDDLVLADNTGAVIGTSSNGGVITVTGPSFPSTDDFEGDQDGWTFAGILPDGSHPQSGTNASQLLVGAVNDGAFPQFGFWQSPNQTAVKSSLYRFRFSALTDDGNLADAENIPTHRYRVNFIEGPGTPQSVDVQNDSKTGGNYLVGASANDYDVLIQPQSDAPELLKALDLTYFDPFNHIANIILEEVVTDRVGLSELTGQTAVQTFDFDADEEGWSSNDFGGSTFPSTTAYNGTDQTLDITSITFPSLGFWQSPAINVDETKINRFCFSISTDVADPANVPTVRCRFFTPNNEISHTMTINSAGTSFTASPTATPKNYYVYWVPNGSGQQVQVAFDMVGFDFTDDLDGSTVKLHSMTYETWDMPPF